MDNKLIKAVYVILISLGLAVIFNFLFFDKLIGLSVLIFAVILLGTAFLFGLREQVAMKRVWWIVALVVFFALMPSVRVNGFLTFLNICATLGLLLLLAHELAGTRAFIMKLRDYLALMFIVPFRMLGRALSTVSLVAQIRSNVKHHNVLLRVVKGVIMAVPVLIIFGVLFSQADLAFSQFVGGIAHINISELTIQYFVLLFVAFVASLSFLSYIFFPKQKEDISSSEKNLPTVDQGKGIEVAVFLGLISTLFLVFIGFQVTYLFGGEANIINAGFRYAEYARRGFWELLAVVILSLFVLFASEKYSGVESKKDRRFLTPALILIVEVGIVIFSAFKRLSLYIDAYGMTLQRFYVAGFIMLLSVLFILLAIKFIKSKSEQFFTFGTFLSIVSFLIVVNLVNPDAFIIKTNMEQYARTGKIDVVYVTELSVDAVPWEIELYDKLKGEEKQVLRALLLEQKDILENSRTSWQGANLSRARALKLLKELR
jgi:hypothetical protein